tara:strand:- start:554 stop:739 length:186 start_codon:yes stop_codon:yes gene_type:complete
MNHTSTHEWEWEPLDFFMIAVMVVIVIVAIKYRPGRGVLFDLEEDRNVFARTVEESATDAQ